MTEFYTKEYDDEGNIIKHIHIPENAQQLISTLVQKEFEKMCVSSGIPKDLEDRQDLFHWLKTLRKYGNKVIGLGITSAVLGLLALIAIVVKLQYSGLLDG